jgi:hypothetical protein
MVFQNIRYRVQGFLSSRQNWLPPPSHPQASVSPPGPRGGTHSRAGEWAVQIKGQTRWYSSYSIITLRTEPMRHKVPRMPQQCLSPHPNWDPPPFLIVIRNYVPPSEPKEEGTHSPAGEGAGWSQFGRLEKKPITQSTLCHDAFLTTTNFILCGDLNLNICRSDPHHIATSGAMLRIRDVYPGIPDPDFYPSRIPDPKTGKKERGKKIVVIPFFCSHKYHKI